MLNNKDTIAYLQSLGLGRDEAKVYLELLKGPSSHLHLARATGVNRTKVYRIADDLEKRSLITTRTDDRGTLLAAADPHTLEVELVTREEHLKNQRAIFRRVLPELKALTTHMDNPERFSVQTYEGVEGFKQMLWHELKAKDELLILGSGTIDDLVSSKRWAEKHRVMTVEADYEIREILNPGGKTPDFTKNPNFKLLYHERYLPPDELILDQQISIYNDTVATYCWRHEQKVGVEIINAANATMMRQMFERYWNAAHRS